MNKAGPEHRQDLREYAIDLLREGTEAVDAPAARQTAARRSSSNPLGMGLLLLLVGMPMCLLFPPVGLALVAVALIMSLWGVVVVLVRR